MKFSSLLRMASVAVLCLAAGVASAGTPPDTPISSITLASTGSSGFGNAITGSFSDIFTFTMPASATKGGAGAISVSNFTGITFTDLSIWRFDGSVYTEIASSVVKGIGYATLDLFTFGSGSNAFQMRVAGDTTPGSSAQSYGGSISVSPIPEPQTYAMLLAGLGLLAFTARRRRNSFF